MPTPLFFVRVPLPCQSPFLSQRPFIDPLLAAFHLRFAQAFALILFTFLPSAVHSAYSFSILLHLAFIIETYLFVVLEPTNPFVLHIICIFHFFYD